jgi:hypothetical protein
VIIGADVPPADVVALDDEDVRLVCSGHIQPPFTGSLASEACLCKLNRALGEAHHHGEKGEDANEGEQDTDR